MSNTQVGNIYSQIIGDVIDSSRVDFEEGGVDEHVLEELRTGWQQKLSQLGVASFPWDPKPEPVMSNPPTVPSNAMHYPQQQQQQQQQQPMGTPPIQQNQGGLTMPMPQTGNNNSNASRIKAEPGLENPLMNNGGQPQPYPNGLAIAMTPSERAAANLQHSFGPRANASINAIQNARQAPNGQQPQMSQQQYQMMQQQRAANGVQQAQARGQPQGQGQQGQQSQMIQEQYKLMIQRQMASQMPHATGNGQNVQHNGVGGAQTDGAGDEVESMSVIKQLGADGEVSMGRIEIDGLLRSKIEAMATRMEGGGLMLPLREASSVKSRKTKVKSSRHAGAIAQADGVDDDDDADVKDEEVDEDAINSDLDDPDDNINDEEDEDEGMGHIMLCMYDKVQRVKNKWKCVMKDGVLTVNGKEYVFHRATGEYEW